MKSDSLLDAVLLAALTSPRAAFIVSAATTFKSATNIRNSSSCAGL